MATTNCTVKAASVVNPPTCDVKDILYNAEKKAESSDSKIDLGWRFEE